MGSRIKINDTEKFFIIAHRGASSVAPENTLKAFQKAIDLSADFLEFDVHQSKDGEIVIMHDGNTFRTTGYLGSISNLTLQELKKLDCGEGERIPTLVELIKIARGKVNLNCEMKARGIEEKVIKILKEEKIIEDTIISSFKHDILLKIQKLEPQIRLASLEPTRSGWVKSWMSIKQMLRVAIENKFYAINPYYKLVDLNFVEKAHKNEIKIFPWTVNSVSSIRKLINLGVDGIITNKINRVKLVMNEFQLLSPTI